MKDFKWKRWLPVAAVLISLALGILLAVLLTRSNSQKPLILGERTITLGNPHSGAYSLNRSAAVGPSYSTTGYMKGYQTLSWPTVSGAAGYALSRDGLVVATAGENATSTRFYVQPGIHTLTVTPLSTLPPPPTAVTPPPATSASAPTYESETAYTKTLLPFTVVRDVPVSSASALNTALGNIKCGDKIHATTAFTVTGQFGISANPTCVAVVELYGVAFTGGASAYAAAWVHNASNLRLYGGDVSNPYDYGIEVNGPTRNVLWWGFIVHDVGTTGLAMFPNGGDISGNDFSGEISKWNKNPALDPHAEKGTGNHGANLADMTGTTVFSNNRLALDVHDGPGGAGVEIGDDDGSPIAGNTLYLRAQRLTMAAQTQVAGNALQLWGRSTVGLTVHYLEANDLQGKAVEQNGVYSGTSMAGVTVEYGRAMNTLKNPKLAGQSTWDPKNGIHYLDVK